MIILDTNVVSELMRERPDDQLIGWLDRQPSGSLWTTAVTVLEIRFGLAVMPAGRKEVARRAAFDRFIADVLGRRIVPFDAGAAAETAGLMGVRQRREEPRDLRDSMIAGIALARRARIATRNVKDFDDLAVAPVDPWAGP